MIAWLACLASLASAQAASSGYATQTDFVNVAVSFTLPEQPSAQPADVVRVSLRRQAPDSLYEAVLDRSRGLAELRKRAPGGPGGRGVSYLLGPAAALVTYGDRPQVRASVVNQRDGAVTLSLYVNGSLAARAVDDGAIAGPPIRAAGAVGIKGDEGDVRFEGLEIVALPGAYLSPLGTEPDSAARAPQRFLTPARADGINDAAFFGPAAARVTIFDLRGRRVYEAEGAALHWDGRDGSGRLVESGLYIARIRKTDGGACYQSFAVAK